MTQPLTKDTKNRISSSSVEISVLKNRQDFLRLAAGRKKWVSKSMIVQIAARPDEDSDRPSGIRVGYTASKKVGNAVHRNRAKRRLRDVVRQILPTEGREGYDYVLIARTATLETSFDQLIRDFSWCLKRLNQANVPAVSTESNGKSAEKPPSSPPNRGN